MTTRWCFDTEFNEDGRIVDLISIGLISESGLHGYYAHSADYRPEDCNLWVKQNVLPKVAHIRRKPRSQIASEIVALIDQRPEFWAYHAATDWVVMYQLFGTMMDLPKRWPKHCLDLKQEMVRLGVTRDDIESHIKTDDLEEHDSLDDAKWCRRGLLWIKQAFPTTWHGATAPMGASW